MISSIRPARLILRWAFMLTLGGGLPGAVAKVQAMMPATTTNMLVMTVSFGSQGEAEDGDVQVSAGSGASGWFYSSWREIKDTLSYGIPYLWFVVNRDFALGATVRSDPQVDILCAAGLTLLVWATFRHFQDRRVLPGMKMQGKLTSGSTNSQ